MRPHRSTQELEKAMNAAKKQIKELDKREKTTKGDELKILKGERVILQEKITKLEGKYHEAFKREYVKGFFRGHR